MVSPKESLVKKNIFAEKYDEIRRLDGSELRVWSYEPFIVFAPSSSGYISGQNLEVLYIIRNVI